MECHLRVTHENKNPRVEITYNPGNFDLPEFKESKGIYSIQFQNAKILSVIAQSNDDSDVFSAQVKYTENNIDIKFVTMNMETRNVDFTVSVILNSTVIVDGTVIPRGVPSIKTEGEGNKTITEVLGRDFGSLLSIAKSRP